MLEDKTARFDIRITASAGRKRPFVRTITGLTGERVLDYAQTTLRVLLPALDAMGGSTKVEMLIDETTGSEDT
jgi:hypothetical protein